MRLHLHDLIDPIDLQRGIADRLINIRDDGNGLRILNYSAAAMYTPGAWGSPAVRTCRGLIVDADDRVIARPWAKFFNHGQDEAGTLDLNAPVEVTDKLDGSLGILYRDNDETPRVATRGSFTSEQAIHATQVLHDNYVRCDWNDQALTPLVEIVYPGNRIVCDYGDLDDLILLGSVDVITGAYYGPGDTQRWIRWTGPVADTFAYQTLADALAAPPRPGKEGMAVRYLHEPRIVKIKQDDYVRLHRIVTGLSERTVWEHMTAGQPVTALLGNIPDELHQWVRDVWNRLADETLAIAAQADAVHAQILAEVGDDAPRKDYAIAAQKHPEVRPYLFQLLDGHVPHAAILRTLKPAGDTRALAITEDVA